MKKSPFHLSPVILALMLCLGAGTDCEEKPAASPPTAPRETPAVVLRNSEGVDWTVLVEVARTPEQQAQGLMHRESLGEDRGMIFVYPDEEVRRFWMKNTLIPLDMIFIRADHTIAGIVENAEPETETGRAVDAKSRWVLEVNGGACQKHEIKPGGRVWLFGIKD